MSENTLEAIEKLASPRFHRQAQEDEQVILRLLRMHSKLDGFVHCMWGFLLGYAASRGDNVDDLLREYAVDIRAHLEDAESAKFIKGGERKTHE